LCLLSFPVAPLRQHELQFEKSGGVRVQRLANFFLSASPAAITLSASFDEGKILAKADFPINNRCWSGNLLGMSA
jgi:hypothetical protein